jgi:sortase (surface protein transpeptidase)
MVSSPPDNNMTEVIIYHVYNKARSSGTVVLEPSEPVILPLAKEEKPVVNTPSSILLLKSAKIFAVIGIVVLAINYAPFVAGWVGNGFSFAFKSYINLTKSEAQNITQSNASVRSTYQPAYDSRLPKENRLVISKIGVDTEIAEATFDNYESALKQGVWRVSDFGAPSANSMPTILAAHRYGYLAWSNLFRRENSFYNLPKLKVGDIVEIDWRQRKYTYEIYAEGQGEEITDYTADLILYTCVDLTGPERVFRYARLMEI